MKKWCPLDEVDGETEDLVFFVEAAWCWWWPGWEWVAEHINDLHGNNRTAQACRAKYNRLIVINDNLIDERMPKNGKDK